MHFSIAPPGRVRAALLRTIAVPARVQSVKKETNPDMK